MEIVVLIRITMNHSRKGVCIEMTLAVIQELRNRDHSRKGVGIEIRQQQRNFKECRITPLRECVLKFSTQIFAVNAVVVQDIVLHGKTILNYIKKKLADKSKNL